MDQLIPDDLLVSLHRTDPIETPNPRGTKCSLEINCLQGAPADHGWRNISLRALLPDANVVEWHVEEQAQHQTPQKKRNRRSSPTRTMSSSTKQHTVELSKIIYHKDHTAVHDTDVSLSPLIAPPSWPTDLPSTTSVILKWAKATRPTRTSLEWSI